MSRMLRLLSGCGAAQQQLEARFDDSSAVRPHVATRRKPAGREQFLGCSLRCSMLQSCRTPVEE